MKVCMVVPNALVKGGIAAVVNGYRGSQLEKDNEIIYVESYCDGNKMTKLRKGLFGYIVFLYVMIVKRPDIVHIHSSFGPSFYRKIPFIEIAKWFKKPVINHIHGAEFDAFYRNASDKKKTLIKRVYDKCDAFIALSDEWKKNLSEIVPEEKITVIENYSSLNHAAYQERIERSSNNCVLFLGELGKRKGCYDIPEIIKLTSEKIPNVKFVLAGDGTTKDIDAIKSLIHAAGVEQNVVFPGWIRGIEKDKWLREADIFLLPSYNEGMPMSILDAMGYGLPIVSTNVGGIPRIVLEGINGFCVLPGEKDKIANNLSGLLTNERLLKEFSRNSYYVVKEKYSLEKHIERLVVTYKKYY